MDMGIEYENYKRLIYKKAHSFNITTGIPFDDLVAEGNLIFCEACKDYQEGRAAFSTYLWKRLDKGLYNYTKSINKHTYVNGTFIAIDIINEDGENTPPVLPCNKFGSYTDFLLLKESLSDKAFQIVSAVTDNPHMIFNLVDFGKPKKARGSIYRHLHKNEGWSWAVIWKAFDEVKKAVC